jgi:tetratricopeptide (TPR) repeat protein
MRPTNPSQRSTLPAAIRSPVGLMIQENRPVPRLSGFFVPATCCALALAGCASPPSGGPSTWFSKLSSPFSTSTASSKPTPLPDVKTGPSALEQFNESVATVPRSIGNSFVNGARTVGHWMVPGSQSTKTGQLAAPAVSDADSTKPKIGPDLYVASARLHEHNGNFIGAAEQYEKALKIDPNNLVAMLSCAHMLDRQGKLDQATPLYQRAAQTHPHEAAAFNDLGLCYARRRMLNESIAALSDAVRLQPERELYRNNLATVLVEQNRADEALKQLQAVQADSVAHYNVGYLLQQHGQNQLAAAYFNQAAQMDPTFTAARDWSLRIAQRTAGSLDDPALARMTSVPYSNGYLPGNRYFAQQTSATYPAAPTPQYTAGNLQALPPVQ